MGADVRIPIVGGRHSSIGERRHPQYLGGRRQSVGDYVSVSDDVDYPSGWSCHLLFIIDVADGEM